VNPADPQLRPPAIEGGGISGVVLRAFAAGIEKKVLSVGQELRPEVTVFPTGGIQFRHRLGRAARGRNAVNESRRRAGGKENCAIPAPSAAPGSCNVGDREWRAARGVNPAQLVIGRKSDVAAV